MAPRTIERPLASLDALDRVWLVWRVSIHILVAILSLITLLNDGLRWQLVLFIAAYAAGRFIPRKWVWVLGVTVLWTLLLVVSPTGAFIAFALFFMAINTLQTKPAVGMVVVIMAIAVFGLGRHNGWTVGGVVGPVLGALVACALGFGFLQLRSEAFARASASRVAGEAGERARLAGEIHDTVAQGLSSIQMLLHSIEHRELSKPNPDETSLQQIRLAKHTASENLKETRRIIAALQPGALIGTDLPVALARVASSTPMGTNLTFDTDGDTRALGEELDATIIRIAQSLISNVVRHSHATRARVTLTYEPEYISLDVVDNGVGFRPDASAFTPGSTLGMAGVLTRAEQLGGTMTVESAPGEGTGVSVRIPAPSKGTAS